MDAIAFGHLYLHSLPNLAQPKLFSILTCEFPNLIQFCERIKAEFFQFPAKKSPIAATQKPFTQHLQDLVKDPGSYLKYWQSSFTSLWRKSDMVTKTREERVQDFYTFLSVAGSVAFFVGYIVKNGIIQISTPQEEEEEQD